MNATDRTTLGAVTNLERSIAELDNVLVDQKNAILSAISSGQDLEGLQKAEELLKFVSPLWFVLGYDYKTTEMKSRIKIACNNLIMDNENYLEHCRKNCKTRSSVESENNKLMDLLESL